MPDLASILAGVGGNPYQQQSQGVNPILQQGLLDQQMMQAQQAAPQAGVMPSQGAPSMQPPMGAPMQPGMPGQPQAGGLGSLAGVALPQIANGIY